MTHLTDARTRTDAAPATGRIEFDGGTFPRRDAAAIEAKIIRDAVAMIGAARLCPYCLGRGQFAAHLEGGAGHAVDLTALCGQCMGEGNRPEADALAMIERIFATVREQVDRETGFVYDPDARLYAIEEERAVYVVDNDAMLCELEAEAAFWADWLEELTGEPVGDPGYEAAPVGATWEAWSDELPDNGAF